LTGFPIPGEALEIHVPAAGGFGKAHLWARKLLFSASEHNSRTKSQAWG
jgi:hypothetical protein